MVRWSSGVVAVVVACGEDDPVGTPTCRLEESPLDGDCDGSTAGSYCSAGLCVARPRWTAPDLVAGAIESPTDEQSFATLRLDNLEMIFSSTRLGGSGCTDLWRAGRSSTQSAFIVQPEPLLGGVNSPSCESGAILSGDGLELLFFRDDMLGSNKIMRATRTSFGATFGPPLEVTELNIDAFPFNPSISADGLTLVFQSGPAPGATLDVFQTQRAPSSTVFDTPTKLTELGPVGLGVGLDPTGRYLVAFDQEIEQFVVYTRDSPSSPFGAPLGVPEISPNPSFPALGTPFVTRDGRELYFNRRNDDNHLEIWSARRD